MRIDEYIVPENVIPIIRNKQVLEGMPENTPFVKKEDLVVLFRIEIPSVTEDQISLIQVTDEIMESWGKEGAGSGACSVYETDLRSHGNGSTEIWGRKPEI